MAYVFMTDEDDYVDGTWEPDGGENAVILQPGTPTVTVQSLATGPTLYRMVEKMFRSSLVQEPCEFAASGPIVEDPEFVVESERAAWTEEKWKAFADALDGNKIGGTPKAPEPTPTSVTPRATLRIDEMKLRTPHRNAARGAPAVVVAHL
jgi:hypothetical protein